MGGKKGGSAPAQNIVQNTAPWSGQQGYLTTGFERAREDILKTPHPFYPDQTYASFSPQTENALNMTEARAMAGSPVLNAGKQQLQNTLNGNYLFGGPGFDAAYTAARNKILPDIESRFNAGGRFGSGLSKVAEAEALSDAFAKQYGEERTNQLRASLFAPQMAESDYKDLAALLGVGGAREDMTQTGIDEKIARHEHQYEEPRQRIRDFMSQIGGNYGMQGNTFTPGFKGNRGAGVLGGALGGAGAGASFGPWGAGIGGILGGLTGLF